MRDIWFGDKRDLIKWSVLMHLADRFKADRVLQIAYYRPSRFGCIVVDDERIEVRPEVTAHFRDIRSIEGIHSRVRVTVFEVQFTDRRAYLDAAIELVQSCSSTRCIIFLDPDTGLQPVNPGFEHVLEDEVRQVWLALKAEDVLVFYQHQTNRNGQPWIEPKREQLARSMQVDPGSLKIASAPEITADVVLYYCQKDGAM